jgi:hypothetical protein
MSAGTTSAGDQGRLATLDKIRTYFEGKEAIYIEKGALRVRVSNIGYADFAGEVEYVEAELEEIPTPGLPVHVSGYDRRGRPRPLRWKIGTNLKFNPHFSRLFWSSGPYGGWSMHFYPKLIEGVVELASEFPRDQEPFHGYRLILKYISRQTGKGRLQPGCLRGESLTKSE